MVYLSQKESGALQGCIWPFTAYTQDINQRTMWTVCTEQAPISVFSMFLIFQSVSIGLIFYLTIPKEQFLLGYVIMLYQNNDLLVYLLT